MKKVLALVLAVVMVVGMASVATFAADPFKVVVKYDGKDRGEGPSYEIVAASGKEITVELKNAPKEAAYKVEIKKQDDATEGSAVVLTKQDGNKYTFTATCKPTTGVAGSFDYIIYVKPVNDKAQENGYDGTAIKVRCAEEGPFVTDEALKAIKEANKDATVKAELALGDYVTISNITSSPKTLNIKTIDTPSAVAEALKGKNFAFAGYKFLQPLPGVGTMTIELNADLLLAGAEKVYVYEVSGDSFKLVASSADDKMFEVKDGEVEFPVSRLSQYVITDKALSSTSTGSSSGSNNPGTGANDMVGAAVVMALVAGAGIVAFKK